MAHDELVGWGWSPGEGRTPAPGTQQQFGELIRAWIDSGAACPAHRATKSPLPAFADATAAQALTGSGAFARLVELRDAAALARDLPRARTLGRHAREVAEPLGWDKVVADFEAAGLVEKSALGPVAFVGAWIGCGLATPGYSAVDDAISEPVPDDEVEVLDADELLEEARPKPQSPYDRSGRWFVVHTQSGYEKKVKQNLEARISSMNMEERIHEVVIPMEDVVEFKNGKKVVVQKKVFPGYLLVRCEMDDDSWYVIRNTPGVTGFVGSTDRADRPAPLSLDEVLKWLAPAVQVLDDGVVVRVILKSAARINDAGEAEPVEFTHEMARGIHLMFRRQLWTFRKRCVEDRGIGSRDKQAGRIALGVALNFAARRIRSAASQGKEGWKKARQRDEPIRHRVPVGGGNLHG